MMKTWEMFKIYTETPKEERDKLCFKCLTDTILNDGVTKLDTVSTVDGMFYCNVSRHLTQYPFKLSMWYDTLDFDWIQVNINNTKQTSKSDVYNAINRYFNSGRHETLKKLYEDTYKEYVNAGGDDSLQDFFDTIDNYAIEGHCGY